MTRDVRAGMVTPGGVKTITRLVRCSVQQPPGPWRSCPAPATLIEVQIWPPGVPLCPLPTPSGGRTGGGGDTGHPGPMSAPLLHQILTSIVPGMDHIPAISHIPRVDAKQTRFSSPSSSSSLHSHLHILVRPAIHHLALWHRPKSAAH